MLRGVNKSIIEIPETENKYFEKAILFVRKEFIDKDGTALGEKAGEYLKGLSPDMENKLKCSYRRLKPWMSIALSGAAGAIITALIFIFI